jgi:hypothetical protein
MILIPLSLLGLGLIGFLLWHGGAPSHPASARHYSSPPESLMKTSEAEKAEEDKIVLGDVEAVPFQELYGVLSRRSPGEIAELARQLQNLPKSPAAKAKIAAFFKAWATLDASAAFAFANSLRPDLRSEAFSAVLEGADASVTSSLVPAISKLDKESLPPNEKTLLLARAVGKWSQLDPVAAAKFLDSSGLRGMNFSMAYDRVASNWAARDPVAALSWAREQASKGDRFATSGAITGWWKNDPAAAEAYVASHLATQEDWQLASTLASNIFGEDPERAKEWVRQLPNEDARRQADVGLAIHWGFSDPAGATKWAATLPPGEGQQTLAETVGLWAQQDLPAGAEWLGSYEGAGRDQAVDNFILTVAAKDPAGALTWAATISDPKTRVSAEQRLASEWLKRDPPAARKWIESSSLPAEEKSRLLAPSSGP